MGSFQDLTGQQFGTLVVQKYIGGHPRTHGKWLCKCSKCGKQVMITTNRLRKNATLGRDGCKHQTDPQPGDIFGYLTVIAQADDYIKPKTGHHEKCWKCRCICGREKDILQSNLKSGKSTTCGLCSNRISIPEKTMYYYLSQIFDDIEENYRPDFLKGKEIDIFIPSLQLGIEYDGERWHKDLDADIAKNTLCLENGIHLLRIREPKCPKTDQFEYQIITPKPTTNGTHMTRPIKELLLILQQSFNISCQLDVDCLRDNAIICKTVLSTAGFNSLAEKYPDIAQEWDYKQNAPLTPDKMPAHSGRKAWWICPKCHKSYDSVIASRTGSDKCSCPHCRYKKAYKRVMCVETGHIFNSVKEAAESVHRKPCSITSCCKGYNHTSTVGGYHWQYIEEEARI